MNMENLKLEISHDLKEGEIGPFPLVDFQFDIFFSRNKIFNLMRIIKIGPIKGGQYL